MQRYFFAVWIPVFIVAFVLQSTYRAGWVPGGNLGQNLLDQRAYQDRDLSVPRMALFFIIEAFILCSFWRWM